MCGIKIVINRIPFRFYFLAKYFERAIVSFLISFNVYLKIENSSQRSIFIYRTNDRINYFK